MEREAETDCMFSPSGLCPGLGVDKEILLRTVMVRDLFVTLRPPDHVQQGTPCQTKAIN